VTFRLATAADVPALHALVERAYRGEAARSGWTHEADLLDGQRTDRQALAAMLADPAQAMLVTGDPIHGCVALTRRGTHAYLGMLTVAPDGQARGLGRALLTAAEAHAQGWGACAVEMTVIRQRTELIAWYQRRGYALTGEVRPFPMDDPRFGLPKRVDLAFVVLEKRL
jgi:GNAT superfamily N-acetyltransferase